MLCLSLVTKRFFDGLADEGDKEGLLCRLQKRQLPLRTSLKINATWLIEPFMQRTFLRETIVEKNN